MKSLEDHGLSPNTPIDVACTPELNHWNGYDRIQLRIRDIRAAGCE
jgi:single-stranded-DNA-specific exonuclease